MCETMGASKLEPVIVAWTRNNSYRLSILSQNNQHQEGSDVYRLSG